MARYFNMHPLPRQTDRFYKGGYISRIMAIENRLKLTVPKDIVSPEAEPLLEAVELAGMGKNSVVQHGYTANLAGIDCLRRYFPNLQISAMNFPGDPYRYTAIAHLRRCVRICF